MSRQRYWVDWRDGDSEDGSSLPKIRKWNFSDPQYAPSPLSFQAAKRAIVEHFTHEMKRARENLSEVRALRAQDIEE